MKKLRILHDTQSAAVVAPVQRALEGVYRLETVELLHQAAETVETAFSRSRRQYNATKLLSHLVAATSKRDGVSLWIVSDDMYVAGMNFVFGLAHTGKAAVLSIHRLYSEELIVKEAIHELGHVLGLQHCANECVMRYSNSLAEAETKPMRLCERCRAHVSYL